jgi:heterodisulfide reductase subunit A
VDFAAEGVFLCGLAHGPKSLEENIAQARAAAGRAGTVLSRTTIEAEGTTAVVNKRKCTACGTCVEVCPAGAVTVDLKERVAVVNEAVCKGCGACAASCRCGAMNVRGWATEQIMALVEAV